jgi:glucose-6-phosphate 1-dehydrogenase
MIGQQVELLASSRPGAEDLAYERVLGDALVGDSTLFAREDYVEEAWRIVDPVIKAATPVHEYEPGSWGPKEANDVAPAGGWQNPVVTQ